MARQSDTREKLIRTMLELMWREGYAASTVDRVCKAAQVNKGSFYHFFPAKEELALAALDAGWTSAKEGIYNAAFDALLHPLERLNRLAEMTLGFHQDMIETGEWHAEQGCPFGNLGAEAGAEDARIKARVREIYEEEADYFRTALEDAVVLGCIPPCDTREMAKSLVALQSGLFQHAKIYGEVGWLARFVPLAAALIGAREKSGKFVVPKGVGTR